MKLEDEISKSKNEYGNQTSIQETNLYEKIDKWIEKRNFEILPEFTLAGKIIWAPLLFGLYIYELINSRIKTLYRKRT